MTEGISFGSWLKQRRKEFGFTQEELAREVGCSAIAVRKIEADDYRPSKQIALRLADLLEIPVSEYDLFVRFARAEGHEDIGRGGMPLDTETPWRAVRATPNNLPAQLTRLIDREQAIADVTAFLVQAGARLVTLTGPPGVGKTRLAIEVAATMLNRFENGSFVVALAPITEPDHLLLAIAQTLGIKEAGTLPLAHSLRLQLRDKHMLLVLDNFEQLMDAATQVEELLGTCPDLSVLVTSREVLRIHGEQQFPVPPLELPALTPAPARSPSLQSLSANPAVALFVERARSVSPGFELSEENAQAVAAICAQLDGLPLAIEIAAARVKILSPEVLLARLESGMGLLLSTPPPYRDRPQTLRGAIEWSYRLLDSPEQRLFARLGVFAGGCSLSAIEAVCNARGDMGIEALDGVQSLVDKSLLARVDRAQGEYRFAMLDTIREYALEALENGEHGNAQAIRRNHAEYYLALAEGVEPELRGTRQAFWLDRLQAEHDNLRAALRWAQQSAQDIALRMVAALWRYWWTRGYLSEGRDWLRTILAQATSDDHPAWKARALRGAGWLAYAQGDYPSARSLFEQSLALFRQNDDKRGTASTLDNLGAVAFTLGDNAAARLLYEQSLAIRKDVGEEHAIATSLNNLGLVATAQSDFVAARPLLEESLSLYRHLDDAYGIATSLNNLALLARCQGEGDDLSGVPLLKESLEIRKTMTDRYAIAYSLAGYAGLAGRQADSIAAARRAARLLAATQTLLEAIGARLENVYLTEYNRTLDAVRAHLGEEEYQRAWQEGRVMSMEEAIEYALEQARKP
jgi:predicted ATPase/transcriptional regulator with XRE-family HTH domain